MLCRLYGWYWFLLPKKTPYSSFTSLITIFCVFSGRFSFKLGWHFLFSKSSQKKLSGFSSSDFLWATKTFPNLYPTWTYPTESMNTKQDPPRNLRLWRHFFLGDPIQGSWWKFSLKGGVQKCWFFLRWKNGHFGENRGVCAQKEQLLPLNLTWNLKITRWKRKNIFQIPIFGFHVSFRRGNDEMVIWISALGF